MTQRTDLGLLLESFARNGRVNEVVLDTITEVDLALEDSQGGWNVGQHLGHLAEFRYSWLRFISPPHAENIPSVVESDMQNPRLAENPRLTAQSLDEIKQAFSAGDIAALEAVTSALGGNRSFEGAYKSHPTHFLQHIIVHDAHHRGQIFSLLRRGGWTREQLGALDDATWSIWNEEQL